MGRKKAAVANQAQEPFELKPFCYYCEREFDTTKTLIQHQRTKHFNCAECGLKFDTVTGLRVHMLNAYKKTMKEVPNAMRGRENPDIVVHGMEGLPKGILEERTRKALAERAEREQQKAERAAERAEAQAEEEEGAPPQPPEEPKSTEPSVTTPQPQEVATPSVVSAPPALPPKATPPSAPPNSAAGPDMQSGPVHSKFELSQLLAIMPHMSSATQKLLSARGDEDSDHAVVPGNPGQEVPHALRGLHSVALQVLGAAGALTPPQTSSQIHTTPIATSMLAPPLQTEIPPEQDLKRMRLVPPG